MIKYKIVILRYDLVNYYNFKLYIYLIFQNFQFLLNII